MGRLHRLFAVIATIGACGRVGFQTRASDAQLAVDAPTDAAPARIVTMGGSPGSATGASISIAATQAGDLLVVGVVTWDGTPVTSITAGSVLTSGGVRAVMANTSSELWYASPVTAGVTTLNVAMGGSASGYDVFVAEFSGIAAGPPAASAQGCLQYPPTVDVATVTTSVPGALVIGTTMLAYPAYAAAVGAPFTALPFEDGNGTAFFVADTPGSYGPAWTVGMGSGMTAMTCSSTLAFLPEN